MVTCTEYIPNNNELVIVNFFYELSQITKSRDVRNPVSGYNIHLNHKKEAILNMSEREKIETNVILTV